MKLRLFFVITICIFLVSCAGRQRAPDPTPLTKITASSELVTLWRGQFSESRSGSASSFKNLIPILVDDRIIGASENGSVSAIDKNSGSRLWTTRVESGVIAGVGEGNVNSCCCKWYQYSCWIKFGFGQHEMGNPSRRNSVHTTFGLSWNCRITDY